MRQMVAPGFDSDTECALGTEGPYVGVVLLREQGFGLPFKKLVA